MPIVRKPPELPKYPGGSGSSVALQSPHVQGKYTQLIAKLRAELERCDEAFADALARADTAAATQNRIEALATAHRRNNQNGRD